MLAELIEPINQVAANHGSDNGNGNISPYADSKNSDDSDPQNGAAASRPAAGPLDPNEIYATVQKSKLRFNLKDNETRTKAEANALADQTAKKLKLGQSAEIDFTGGGIVLTKL